MATLEEVNKIDGFVVYGTDGNYAGSEFKIENRTFIYKYTHKHSMHRFYECKFIPKGRKKEIYAGLEVYSDGRIYDIRCGNYYGLKYKDKMWCDCVTPSGTKFGFMGNYQYFNKLFGISEKDVKTATRTKKPTKDGWIFKRIN